MTYGFHHFPFWVLIPQGILTLLFNRPISGAGGMLLSLTYFVELVCLKYTMRSWNNEDVVESIAQ